jgi:hypothetical protein
MDTAIGIRECRSDQNFACHDNRVSSKNAILANHKTLQRFQARYLI